MGENCIWCNCLLPDVYRLKTHTQNCHRRPANCGICKMIYTQEMLIAHYDCPFRRPETEAQMKNRYLRLSALIVVGNENCPLQGDASDFEVVCLASARFMVARDSLHLTTAAE